MPACMICRGPAGGLFVGWPGFPRDRPAALVKLEADLAEQGRSARIRVCSLGGECEAQAIATMIRRLRCRFPFSAVNAALEPRVEEILGHAPRERTPDNPEPPAPAQGALL